MGERPRHSDLDEAIDRALRGMMDVDPLPGLERRVMRRLEQPRRRGFAWPQFAAAGTALATMLIIALVLRDAPAPTITPRPFPPSPPSTSGAGTPPNVPPEPTSTAPAPSADRVPMVKSVAPAPRAVMAANVEEETATDSPIATIDALHPPSALVVESIEQRPVSVPNISMSTIDIRQLNVKPLGPPDERAKE